MFKKEKKLSAAARAAKIAVNLTQTEFPELMDIKADDVMVRSLEHIAVFAPIVLSDVVADPQGDIGFKVAAVFKVHAKDDSGQSVSDELPVNVRELENILDRLNQLGGDVTDILSWNQQQFVLAQTLIFGSGFTGKPNVSKDDIEIFNGKFLSSAPQP